MHGCVTVLGAVIALCCAPGCEQKQAGKGGGKACASRQQAPKGDDGQPVASLAEEKLRKALKPGTIAAFDTYTGGLPDVVATVGGLPITREMARAEMMRIMPWGLPSDAAGQEALLERAIGFLADGLRVQGAVELAGLVTEVNERLASLVKQKRGAHPDEASYEKAIAGMWLSPVAHRWVWYRKVGLRALARKKGAADVPDAEVKARWEKNPSALTDGDGNPMAYEAARPFLRDIIAEERVREEARREFEQLLANVEVVRM